MDNNDVKPRRWRKSNRNHDKFNAVNARRGQREENEKEREQIIEAYSTLDAANITHFRDFPLSNLTQSGLERSHYSEPTEIQRESMVVSLKGTDVLGAAKTGSGKTLAFIIPILEMLWRERWTSHDGLGALVISPTRELALQTYEVLCKVGRYHDFSAALIVGGTDVRYQSERILDTNIVICTPGRLLQHMDETATFSCDNLKILVIDEADRILDMGFERQMNAIVKNLPIERQTLLFSATQTKSVKALARLSLKDPIYISVHENATNSTPEGLSQNYIVCEEHEKFETLWSFLLNHTKKKSIIFFSNCKQVRFYAEACRRLYAPVAILALYGTLPQMKRVKVYKQFCSKQYACLFATDIAARGLDFPAVDWVVQADCPPDTNEYIHRSGRTARYNRNGEALLILTPQQEDPMVELLSDAKIPISRIRINQDKMVRVHKKLETFCAQDAEFKALAQRAFVAYLRSVFMMKNKKIFDARSIDHEALSRSMGLLITPRVRFLRRQAGSEKGKSDTVSVYSKPLIDLPPCEDEEILPENSKLDSGATVTNVCGSKRFFADHDWTGNEDDVFTIKKKDVFNVFNDKSEKESDNVVEENVNRERVEKRTTKRVTKTSVAKKLLKKNISLNKKLTFDDEGNPIEDARKTRRTKGTIGTGFSISEAKVVMAEEDKHDAKLYRERIRAKHKEEKRKKKLKITPERNGNDAEHDDNDDDGSEFDAPGTAVLDYHSEDDDQDAASASDGDQPDAKRARLSKKLPKSDDLESDVETDGNVKTNFNVGEAEKLALQLLGT